MRFFDSKLTGDLILSNVERYNPALIRFFPFDLSMGKMVVFVTNLIPPRWIMIW